VVPGRHDVNAAACRAYFANCEADETTPEPPYWPKWRHYLSFLRELRADAGRSQFREEQPWELITVPELRTVVAAINSTMALSHRDEDQYGEVGPQQARWFAGALVALDGASWLRVGLINHDPEDLRDAARVSDLTGAHLDVMVAGSRWARCGSPGRLITVTPKPAGPGVSIDMREL
jgi:hypothetical protein